MRRNRLMLAATLLTLALGAGAACGGDNEVGEGLDISGTGGDGGAFRDVISTTTLPPVGGTGPSGLLEEQRRSTTTLPARATTTAPRTQILEIRIIPAGNSFDPTSGTVRVGQVVRFINTDSVTRQVKGDRGEFDTGPIPPNEFRDWKPRAAGTVNFHDDTRPYGVGYIEVLAAR